MASLVEKMANAASAATSARLATPSIFTRTIMLGIVGSLTGYLASWENADMLRDTYMDKNRDYGETFDFIIVGGGTAGGIVANRLSEKYKVLLLEAGGQPHPFQSIPLLSNYLLNYAELDWRHVTMPQKQAFKGSVQSRASISQGRGLGGTTNLDYMMYLRGHPKDFDHWAETVDDPSWSYKSVSEYFKLFENYDGPWSPENHGTSGEVRIRPPSFTGLGEHFCQAAESNGYKRTDLNSLYSEGCDIINYPTKKGYRDGVYNSFLKPIKERRNLAVYKYAHVNKILIRGENHTAYAVEYDRHGKSRIAYAKKEVILSAGAVQTPKLLMLSGIGPKADLDSVGIPVKADLRVGQGLQDHLSVFLGPFFVERGRSLDIDRDIGTGSVLSLAKDGGPLTTTGFQAAAVVCSGLEKLHGGRNWPDLQLTMYGLSHHISAEEDFSHAYKLKKDLLKSYFEHSKGLDSFSIVVTGGRPKSAGTVKLLNRNPYAPLIINPNYLDKIYDVVVMVDGVKKALRIVENSTVFFEDLHTRFTRQVLPGCETYRFRSDAYFECYVRTMSVSMGNVAGTAAMGQVVNNKLQVKGIRSLRVIDASVMPSIVTTSTGAAVMMIGEKGADMLLTEWEHTDSEAGAVNVKHVTPKPTVSQGDASKSLIDSLKSITSEKRPSSQFSINDLQKLTKSVGGLATILDPLTAAASNVYTGSFDLPKGDSKRNVTSPLKSLAGIAPRLKSQFGGLYQNLFESDSSTEKSKSGGKGYSNSLSLANLKLPILGTRGSTSKSEDPLKLISLLQNSMKELKNVTAMTSALGESLKSLDGTGKEDDMTLDDIFGIVDGEQEELVDFEAELADLLKGKIPPKPTAKTTQKPKTTKTVKPSSSKPTTKKPTTTTLKTTTTTTSTAKSTTVTTTKRPFIDYSYEVLPVPLTPSKEVSSQKYSSPVYSTQGSVQSIKIQPSPIPVSNGQSFKIPPAPSSQNIKIDFQKLKNLEALAQIQHETLQTAKQKQPPKPIPLPNVSALQGFRNPSPELYQFPGNHPYAQYQSSQHFAEPPPPSVNILPPPLNGRFHPQSYYQTPDSQQAPMHPVYDQMLKPVVPYPQLPQPVPSFLRPNQQPPVDTSNLKLAVNTIMNAKYAPPSHNPFAGMVTHYDSTRDNQHPSTSGVDSTVLKSLQLRANVDKFISNAPASPIPITHRPTPPPPTPPSTTHLPPPPVGIEQYEMMKNEENGGIFAPLKDALQPLRSLMTAPLSLLPNPFKIEVETTTASSLSSLLPSFLPSGLFSHRFGPLPYQVPESQHNGQHGHASQNGLSEVMPRFLMNASNQHIPPEVFIRALANYSTDLPKPFVLQPSNTFMQPPQHDAPPNRYQNKHEDKPKKLLGERISDILSQLNNHHFASLSSKPESQSQSNIESLQSNVAANSANEILNMEHSRFPTTVKASVLPSSPKVKENPPIEFHKSPWAKEPSTPSKSLHFRIKIIK